MKKQDIVAGRFYQAKVNGNLTRVRLDSISESTGYGSSRGMTNYHVTNMRTGRKTTFHSAAKFRKELPS